LIALIALGLLNMVMQVPILSLVFSGIAMVLFTVYLIYDIQRVVQGGETNYVLATVAIYLDLVNIFSNLLNILGWVSGED
jgi:modulator of FtsH protease